MGSTKTNQRSDYLKVVKDYLEYEMVQAGFEKNEQPQEEMDEAQYKGKTVKLGKPNELAQMSQVSLKFM